MGRGQNSNINRSLKEVDCNPHGMTLSGSRLQEEEVTANGVEITKELWRL